MKENIEHEMKYNKIKEDNNIIKIIEDKNNIKEKEREEEEKKEKEEKERLERM